jgi:hypothetical protein
MQLFEAATFDRKSGEADLSRRAVEESAVRHSGAPNLQFHNHLSLVILPAPARRGSEAPHRFSALNSASRAESKDLSAIYSAYALRTLSTTETRSSGTTRSF